LWIMWKTYPHFLGITRKMEHPVPLLWVHSYHSYMASYTRCG
jgi:hypothetical protein